MCCPFAESTVGLTRRRAGVAVIGDVVAGLDLRHAPFVLPGHGSSRPYHVGGNGPRCGPFPQADSPTLAYFGPQSGALSQSVVRVTGRIPVPFVRMTKMSGSPPRPDLAKVIHFPSGEKE